MTKTYLYTPYTSKFRNYYNLLINTIREKPEANIISYFNVRPVTMSDSNAIRKVSWYFSPISEYFQIFILIILITAFQILVTHFLILITRFLILITHFLILITRFLILITHFIILITHFLVLITHLLILIRHFLISITNSLTLSLLGYLKTRIRWGGESIWPPPLIDPPLL